MDLPGVPPGTPPGNPPGDLPGLPRPPDIPLQVPACLGPMASEADAQCGLCISNAQQHLPFKGARPRLQRGVVMRVSQARGCDQAEGMRSGYWCASCLKVQRYLDVQCAEQPQQHHIAAVLACQAACMPGTAQGCKQTRSGVEWKQQQQQQRCHPPSAHMQGLLLAQAEASQSAGHMCLTHVSCAQAGAGARPQATPCT